MKKFKQQLIDELVRRTEGEKIVLLRDVAADAGIRHLPRQDAADVLRAAAARVPSYRLLRIMSTPRDSLFRSAALVQRDVEFCAWEEEI